MLQETKVYNAIPSASKDAAAFDANVIDTVEMAYGEFHINVGAIDVAASVLRVMESDTQSDATTLGGSPTEVVDATTKPGASDDGKVIIIGINFVKNPLRKRFIQLQCTAGDGTAGIVLGATFVAQVSGNVSSASRGDDVLAKDYA